MRLQPWGEGRLESILWLWLHGATLAQCRYVHDDAFEGAPLPLRPYPDHDMSLATACLQHLEQLLWRLRTHWGMRSLPPFILLNTLKVGAGDGCLESAPSVCLSTSCICHMVNNKEVWLDRPS